MMSDNHDGCSHEQPVPSVQQTLEEMDFERGIWTAALYGDEHKVRDLLLRGTPVDTIDNAGYTALHYAARNGHINVCQLLLSKGAGVNKMTKAGKATALHRAASAGQTAIVKLLLEHGADLDLKDADGKTAEQRAQDNNHIEILKMFCKKT